MVFDIGRCFVLAFCSRFASLKIGARDDVEMFLEVFGSDGLCKWTGIGDLLGRTILRQRGGERDETAAGRYERIS